MSGNPNSIRVIHVFLTLCVLCALCGSTGCSSLRLAPTESQKQTAELTYGLAVDIDETGAAPNTQATGRLVRGTQAALTYMGRPKVPPDITRFDPVAAQAATDAAKRPVAGDVFAATAQGLSLAAQLAILFGVGGAGFGGKKVLDWIAIAKQKSEALQEIVKGCEVFKTTAAASGDVKAVDMFKTAQAGQSPQTKVLVTELKS